MNATAAFASRENVQGLKNGKENTIGAPIMRAKSRVLASVGNVQSGIDANNISKAERQRLNAEKLSKGYSVVARPREKENKRDNDFKKENVAFKREGDVKKENIKYEREGVVKKENASFQRESLFKKDFSFKQPLKPLKQTKQSVCGQLLRSSSLSVLSQPAVAVVIPKVEVKAATSLTDIPAIPDFDLEDENDKDEFMLGPYVKDIFKYLKSLETAQGVRKKYITEQHLMKESMREVLVDWMFEVQSSFQLLQDTTQMAVAILDRYMQETPKVPKDELQLVAVTCLLIASKYEEMFPPSLEDLIVISANVCTKEQILRTELRILKTLKFNLGRPPPITFMRRFCRTCNANALVYSFSKYFTDLALVQYRFAHHPPSLLSAAALYLALFVNSNNKECSSDLWAPKLTYFTGYSFNMVYSLVPKLARLVVRAPELKQNCVQQIYASSKKYSVSKRPELASAKLKAVAAKAIED